MVCFDEIFVDSVLIPLTPTFANTYLEYLETVFL